MPFISITRLRVKSIFHLIPFMRANEAAAKQLVKTPGFLGGKELIDKGLTFWTLTMWADDANMKTFRNSNAHQQAMQKLPFWCSEASYNHWTQEDFVLPGWTVASTRLIMEGKLTKVRNPSPAQAGNGFPAIKWNKLERAFQPKQPNT
jgi:heme-degrading monooxygenase HmoA